MGIFKGFVKLMLDFELSFPSSSAALLFGAFSAPLGAETPPLPPSSLLSDRDLPGLAGALSFANLLLRIWHLLDMIGVLDAGGYHFRFRQRFRHDLVSA